jgi:hypothetical protein
VVGSALNVVNQADSLAHFQLVAAMIWKVPLTFAVPFFVSMYSTLGASRAER